MFPYTSEMPFNILTFSSWMSSVEEGFSMATRQHLQEGFLHHVWDDPAFIQVASAALSTRGDFALALDRAKDPVGNPSLSDP